MELTGLKLNNLNTTRLELAGNGSSNSALAFGGYNPTTRVGNTEELEWCKLGRSCVI